MSGSENELSQALGVGLHFESHGLMVVLVNRCMHDTSQID